MRHLKFQMRNLLLIFFFVLPLSQFQWGCLLTMVIKLGNLHIKFLIQNQWSKSQNGLWSLWWRLTLSFHKMLSLLITLVSNIIHISLILYHLHAMTHMIDLLHQLVFPTLLILKLLLEIAIKFKVVTLHG